MNEELIYNLIREGRIAYIYKDEQIMEDNIAYKNLGRYCLNKSIIKYQIEYLINFIFNDIDNEVLRKVFKTLLITIRLDSEKETDTETLSLKDLDDFIMNFNIALDFLMDNLPVKIYSSYEDIHVIVHIIEICSEAGVPIENLFVLLKDK